MKALFFVFLLLLCSSVARGSDSGTHSVGAAARGLNAVSMNAAAASRTFTINPGLGYATIVFWFDFTHANDGVISLTCTGGPFARDNDYTLTVCDAASAEGECAAKASGILKSGTANLTADAKWDGYLGVRGAGSVSCVAAHSGAPAAGDVLTIWYVVITQ